MNYFKIIRPVNLIIIILTQVLFREFILKGVYSWSNLIPSIDQTEFFLLILASVLIAAAGYVINDMEDIRVDHVNKPGSNVVDAGISLKAAQIYFLILNIFGLIAGFILAIRLNYLSLGFIFIAIALLLWIYSVNYKKRFLIGNLAVAFLSAMVILILWIIDFFALRSSPINFAEMSKNIPYISFLALGYALFAFLISFIREIIKDIEDMQGDKAAGYNTIPISMGIRSAKIFVASTSMLSIILLVLGQIELFQLSKTYMAIYLLIVQLFLLVSLLMLMKAKNQKEFHRLSQLNKVIMIIGILSMLFF